VTASFDRDEDLSGQAVGEYTLLKQIGSGGMGVVYEGIQPVIGKRVAVKVLRPQMVNDPELVARFLSEARAVNAIRHRGIVDIFSFGVHEKTGAQYFVMEYLEGEPFDALIDDRGTLPYRNILEWSEEVLDALDAAHSKKVIHRDLKPSNLFLVNSGRSREYVKLLDFGIAKLLERGSVRLTRETEVLGTPEYMAPEQARGDQLTAQTDIYAFGCVLFELLTGRCVFEADDNTATMMMHLKNAPPAPSKFIPDIPNEIDELVLWALKKKPDERPNSAAEMRQTVQALKRVFPVERTEASLPPRGITGRTVPHKPPLHRAGADPGIEATVLTSKAPPTDEKTRISRPGGRSGPAPVAAPRPGASSTAQTFEALPKADAPSMPAGRAVTMEAPRVPRPGIDVTAPGTGGGPKLGFDVTSPGVTAEELIGAHPSARDKTAIGAPVFVDPPSSRPLAPDTLPPEVKTVLDRPGDLAPPAGHAFRTTDSVKTFSGPDSEGAPHQLPANDTRPEGRRSRGLLISLAIAALVVMAGLAIAFGLRAGGVLPPKTPTPPAEQR
jgi:serine/threonine protein kinase